jgi:hypothetical protein
MASCHICVNGSVGRISPNMSRFLTFSGSVEVQVTNENSDTYISRLAVGNRDKYQ